MSKSDVNLVWFQTTKGHFGRKDIYKYTLNNLKNHIDLSYFDNKFLSLKIFNDDEYNKILKDFDGFTHFLWKKDDARINDESSYKDYGYYLLTNYLTDIAACYMEISLHKYSKYTLLIEDDSPEILYDNNLQFYIENAISKLESDNSIFSIHMKREGHLESDINYLSENYNEDSLFIKDDHDYNFQNQIFRTDDMLKVATIIMANIANLINIHTERAVRTAIYHYGELENKKFKFMSFLPKLCHSIHIGTNNSQEIIDSFNLTKK